MKPLIYVKRVFNPHEEQYKNGKKGPSSNTGMIMIWLQLSGYPLIAPVKKTIEEYIFLNNVVSIRITNYSSLPSVGVKRPGPTLLGHIGSEQYGYYL